MARVRTAQSTRTKNRTLVWLSTLTALLTAFCFPVDAAHAAEEPMIVFTAVTKDETGLTLTGTVTNADQPLYKAQIALWRDEAPISTREALDAALNTDPAADIGDRVQAPEAVTTISTGSTTFAEGQTTEFTVRASWDALRIHDNGVYLVGVQLRGAKSRWGSIATVDRGRTLITLAEGVAVQSAKVVMFTSPPSLIHDSTFADDHLAQELGGRLSVLLNVARQPMASWAIDPRLYTEISVMAEGYSVLTNGRETEGTGSDAAQEWLDEFDSLSTSAAYRLPYSNPDLSLGLTLADSWMVDQALAAPPPEEIADLPLLVQATNGKIDRAWLDGVANMKPAVILASATSSGAVNGMRVVATQASAYPTGPDSDSSDLQIAARAQAEDYVSNGAITRVIETEADATIALRQPPGLALPTPLPLLASVDPLDESALIGPAEPLLTPDAKQSLDSAIHSTTTYAHLINDEEAAWNMSRPALLGCVSQDWPDSSAAISYCASVTAWLSSIPSRVTLTVISEVTLTSRVTAFPVTITNGLNRTIYVRVTATSSSPLVLTIPSSEVIQVGPGDKVPATLMPEVTRDGDATVIISLQTEAGEAIGNPVSAHITTNQSAWLGWAVIIAAGALFIVGTILRVRSTKKKEAVPATTEASDE